MKNTTISSSRNTMKRSVRQWYLAFLVLFAFSSVTTVFAQGTIGIGSGTSANNFMPINSCFAYNYSQQIVKASEYAAGGGTAGLITKIRFYYVGNGTDLTNWNNWTIYMGHTAKTAFSSDTDWEPIANLNQVFSGVVTPVDANWMEVTLTTPFSYNGTGNIIVSIDENLPSWGCTANWGSYTSSANAGLYYYSDTNNPSPAAPPTGTRTANVARLQLVGGLAQCIPATNVTVVGNTTTTGTASWTASASAPSLGYQYYYTTSTTLPTAATAPTGSVGAGITTAPLSGLAPNTTYYVYIRSNCDATSTSAWSAPASFTTPCGAADVPYTQDFEGATVPDLPECTLVQNVGTGNLWTTINNPGYGFTNKTLRYLYNSTNAANVWFFTRGVNLTAGTSYRIAYKYGSNSTFFIEKLKVSYGTANNAASMTTQLANHPAIIGGASTSTFVDFTPTTSGVYYFGFNAYSAIDQNQLYVDDINITVTPSCDKPNTVSSSATGFTTGAINWTASVSAPAGGYEYYYSTTNTAPTASTTASGTVAAGVTNASLNTLQANTTYYVWVRSKCSATDKSVWTAGPSFTTTYCAASPTSVDGTGITNVVLGTISNPSGSETANYGNYSAQSTNAAVGSTVNFAITYTTGYTYDTKIWVDWNNDMDFDDAGEEVYTGTSLADNPTTLTGSFTVPSNVSVAGSHRVRIGGLDSGPPTPCYTGTYGSYEDYTINVFVPVAPSITGFTPASYCAAAGNITISGNNLSAATALTIGGTVVPITTNTSTQIVASVPAGVSGAVSVTTPGGSATATGTFAVTTPPALALSSTSASICAGATSNVVTITTGASSYNSFTWAPVTGVSGTAAAGYTFNPSATTTYTLTASNSTSGCVTTVTFTVNVNALPTALVLADNVSTCGATAVALSVQGGVTNGTILTQNFNGATNNWTTVNNSTGGTVANAAWTLHADGYVYDGDTYHSNDNSQFYYSNSDAQGSGSTTSTILQSPAFSTMGYTSASLSFYHFFYESSTDSSTGTVEVSLNGTTWTTLQTYNSTTGDYNAFVAVNIALTAAYLNQPTVYVRFKFDGPWRYYWAIDNVSVSGQQTGTITWTPQTNLFTNAAATTPYTGGNATTVYAKPTATTTYTATATNPSGCTVTDQIVVNYTSTPGPTVPAGVQNFCNSATVANLTPSGTGIQWYAAATGGTALSPNTALTVGAGTYYVSQTVNGCESQRVSVSTMVNVQSAPTATAVQSFCPGSTVTLANLSVTGQGIKWYAAATGGTALANTTAVTGGTTYYASQTVNGCESAQRVAVTVQFNGANAPTTANAVQSFCPGSSVTLANLVVTGQAIKWYAAATGGTVLANTTVATGGTTYYASQTVNGCESAQRVAVTVQFTSPDAPTANAIQSFCIDSNATVAELAANGSNIQWYADAQGGTALNLTEVLVDGEVYYASQTLNGCQSVSRQAVTVQLSVPEVPNTPIQQLFCNAGFVGELMPAGNNVHWYASAAATTPLAAATPLTNGASYFVSQTINGCESARVQVFVAITSVSQPTGQTTQVINETTAGTSTIADITVEGTNLVWFASMDDYMQNETISTETLLVSGATYYVAQAIGDCISEPLAITVTVQLGRDGGFDASAFTYYPNPVKTVLNLSYSSDITSVTVFNLLGQKILVKEINAAEGSVDMTALQDGTYIVNVTSGNTVETIKVVKKQ